MIYGFIGAGTITEAMIDGLMASSLSGGASIVVSPRNDLVASRLAARYPNVTVAVSNQNVVDACDVLVLAVRWQIAESVLRELVFSKGRRIISVIAATSHESLVQWTGVSAEHIVRAIPLPFVAQREGVTAIYPHDPAAYAFFEAMGTAVGCDTQAEFDLLAVASALMGTYFGILDQVADWLTAQGLAADTAERYLKPLFASLGHVANVSAGVDFAGLRSEFSTKGGLNEQVFRDFDTHGGSKALRVALDNVLAKVRGEAALNPSAC